ncbi:MAG TPA: glycerophosphodiester phosphodiesterase family protein [Jatrophihabitantaceae bacterium]|nr:glycerophosphodiester phosphodiesterase family protein [Jatrophihabitantaceae bacterium]
MSEGDTGAKRPPRRAADMRAPFWIAHRGMANVYPENTLEAYRGTVALGVDVVEPDCWLTRDGGLVCLHDGTVDRTTDGSGSSHELTVPGASVLRVDAGRWFAAAWPNTLRVPTFTDVLDELGGRAVLCPEAKNAGAGRAIVDRLARYELLDAAIVQSFMQSELRPAVAAGGDAMMLTATSTYDPGELRAAGIRYLGLSAALPPSLVPAARAAGLDVVVWVVDRRVDAAPWLAAGAVGFFSNDPLYLSGRSPVLTSDPFGQRTYYHGHLASSISGDRGTFCAPDGWGYSDTSAPYKGALQGWASPINETPAADRFEITLTVRIDGVSTNEGWAGAFIAAADDRSFDDADRYQPGLGGYHVLLRRSGNLELHVVDDGIARFAGSAETPPIEPGGAATLRIAVTPTQVAVTRADASPPVTVTLADATHRGGYVHLGRRAAAVGFSDIAIC